MVRHPLQPFAPAAFGAVDGEPTVSASRAASATAAQWHPRPRPCNGARHAVAPWLQAPLAARRNPKTLLSLVDLRAFLRDPPGAFLRQRLGLRLPEEADAADDIEPLVLPGRGLQRQQLQQAVFEACVRGSEATACRTLHATACARARCCRPARWAGGSSDAARAGAAVCGRVRAVARHGETACTRTFELDLGDVRLHGRIDALYPAGAARGCASTSCTGRPRSRTAWTGWCCRHSATRAPLAAVRRNPSDHCGPPVREPLPANRRAPLLRALVTLRAWGLREPLPFLPRAGWLWYTRTRRPGGWTQGRASSGTAATAAGAKAAPPARASPCAAAIRSPDAWTATARGIPRASPPACSTPSCTAAAPSRRHERHDAACAIRTWTLALDGLRLIEASAGTGKTYTLATLVTRLVIERGLRVGQILAVTFTEAATQELRERLRQRLQLAARIAAGDADRSRRRRRGRADRAR